MAKQKWLELITKLYPDLHLDKRVIHHSSKSAKKRERLLHWFEKIESIHQKVSETKNQHLEQLYKQMYYDLYIIKEENIPKQYYLQKQKEFGDIEITEQGYRQLIKQMISDQKATLDKWIEYFLYDEDAKNYSFFEKYWIFQGLQTLGKFNKETNKFISRDKTTTYPFPKLNKTALTNTLNLMNEYLNEKTAPNEILDALTSYNFKQLYEYSLNQQNLQVQETPKTNHGLWIKYEQGSDHNKLRNSLQDYYTGWCTAAGENFAKFQLESGDFYVYYTKDKNNEYKIPRIAIRMYGNQIIGEIRGISSNQNLEPEMIPILNQKLEEFPNASEYRKKEHDTNLLNAIVNKVHQNIDLTKEELRFFYEIDRKIETFGYLEDKRITDIKAKRSLKKDLATIFDCTTNDIGMASDYDNYQEFKIWHGDIEIPDSTLENYSLPEVITGSLILNHLSSGKNIILPKIIGGNLELNNLVEIDNLKFPETVGGTIELNKLRTLNNFTFPTNIGGSIYLNNLKTTTNLKFPSQIHGTLNLSNLQDASRLTFPQKINGTLDLSKLITFDKLILPEIIGGYLDLASLTQINNVKLPKIIGGYLNLNSLTTITDLTFPQNIGGYLDLNKLKIANNLQLPLIVNGYLDLGNLTTATNLTLPSKVMGYLNLGSLINDDGITFPHTIEGTMDLSSLITINNSTLPKHLTGYLNLSRLNNLTNLKIPTDFKGKILTSFGIFTKEELEQYQTNNISTTKLK